MLFELSVGSWSKDTENASSSSGWKANWNFNQLSMICYTNPNLGLINVFNTVYIVEINFQKDFSLFLYVQVN